MPRISLRTRDDLPEALRPLWDRVAAHAPFGSQAGALAHRPPILAHAWGMLLELAAEGVVARRHIELALVTVSLLNRCAYCVSHHAPMLAVEGVSPEGAARLLDWRDHPELDAVDRLVVEYAIAVTTAWNRTGDGILARLKEHFEEAQIVELTWRIALCGAFNRFNDILGLEIEPGVAPVALPAEG